ncbi:uncharacterized protein LACBIDRAFT_322419 [Laccaria bicolor S238N-H82]|uniref:Predicted protein n=1 Tax=Laccaria bicolor (strain S238N-H82 / ATCC MYA-4686) TaxID=486041 RepID=B0CW81_LACBS|nr:uncharacterized protein LACBIDRAFT_322419 [Laccaria bicolor S238N-H82]EDR13461.1 predicted protein [Laccaria bicolor S238N-H82]|eukprot:XP_001875959.1 predicted protein [Laccaria bicolor S238N-H82]
MQFSIIQQLLLGVDATDDDIPALEGAPEGMDIDAPQVPSDDEMDTDDIPNIRVVVLDGIVMGPQHCAYDNCTNDLSNARGGSLTNQSGVNMQSTANITIKLGSAGCYNALVRVILGNQIAEDQIPNNMMLQMQNHEKPPITSVQVCEQLNAWLGGYQSILKRMTPGNFNWFLHTMLFYHTNCFVGAGSLSLVLGCRSWAPGRPLRRSGGSTSLGGSSSFVGVRSRSSALVFVGGQKQRRRRSSSGCHVADCDVAPGLSSKEGLGGVDVFAYLNEAERRWTCRSSSFPSILCAARVTGIAMSLSVVVGFVVARWLCIVDDGGGFSAAYIDDIKSSIPLALIPWIPYGIPGGFHGFQMESIWNNPGKCLAFSLAKFVMSDFFDYNDILDCVGT